MEYTKFGEEMRVLRARRHQTMKEIADVLGVTKSFLSSVETGRRSVPKDWIDIIADHYHLKEYPKSILIQAAAASRNFIRISLSGQPGYRRDLAVAFEESFEKIDEDNKGNSKWLLEITDDYMNKNKVIEIEND